MTLQPAAAVPVDADLWWIVYLRGAIVGRPEPYLTGLTFYRSVPSVRPARFVVVRRDGGNVTGLFDKPRVAFDVWASKDTATGQQDATNIANLMIALALRAPAVAAGAGVTDVVHLSGPNSVPDESGQPRRLSLIEATHRAALLTT